MQHFYYKDQTRAEIYEWKTLKCYRIRKQNIIPGTKANVILGSWELLLQQIEAIKMIENIGTFTENKTIIILFGRRKLTLAQGERKRGRKNSK